MEATAFIEEVWWGIVLPHKEYKALFKDRKEHIFCLFWPDGEHLSMKRKKGKHGSPIARSIHLTDSPKTWLCILDWPSASVRLSTEKIYSVALLSCRQCGKWIKTRIKWSCPFPPRMQ